MKGNKYGEGRKRSFSDGSVIFCGFALSKEAPQGISSSHQEDAIGVSERGFSIPVWTICQNGFLIMGRLFWIKIWTEEWLDGSIREQLTAVERSIWVDLLVMAGRSRVSGVIQSNPDIPYSHDYLANRFNVSRGELDKALAHFQEQERIIENGSGITIVNWSKYQNPKRSKDG